METRFVQNTDPCPCAQEVSGDSWDSRKLEDDKVGIPRTVAGTVVCVGVCSGEEMASRCQSLASGSTHLTTPVCAWGPLPSPHVSSPHRGAVFQEAKESLCSPSFCKKVCPVSTGAVFWLLQFFSCVGAQRQQTQAPEFRENRAWTLTATELSLSAAQPSSHGGRTKWGSAATLLWTPAHLAAAPAGGGGSSARASVTCAGQRQAPLDLESATMSPVLAGNHLLTGQWSRLSCISRVPQKDWGGQVNDHP